MQQKLRAVDLPPDAPVSCLTLGQRLEQLPLSPIHWKISVWVGLSMLIGGISMEVFPLALVGIKSEWQLSLAEVSWIMTGSQAILLLATLALGKLAGVWGRRPLLLGALTMLGLGTLLTGLASGPLFLVVSRSLQASGFIGIMLSSNALIVELSPAASRGKLFSFAQTFWAFGDIIGVGLGCFLIPVLGWRYVLMLTSLALLYVFFLLKRIPESPRFLESAGHNEQAVAALRSFEDKCGVGHAPVADISGQARTSGASLLDLWRDSHAKRTFMLSVLSFAYQYITVLTVIWLPTLLVTFGNSVEEAFKFAFIFTFAAVPALFLSAHLMDRIGRKKVLTLYMGLCLVACVGFTYSAGTTAMVVIFGCLLRFSMAGFRAGMQGYVQENFPTHLRTLGAGWTSAIAGIAGTLCAFNIGLLSRYWPGRQDIVFLHVAAVVLIAIVALKLLGSETNGKSLEEAAQK